MPQVSVVIPSYNGGDLLKRAVRGVIEQTFIDWECIVVDDGGSDDLAWIDEVDPRVRRIHQRNSGVSVARNHGVTLAAATKVAFCDQDDEWLPGKLQAQVDGWTTSTTFSVTNFTWVFADGRPTLSNQPEDPTWLSMVRDGHMCLSSLVVDKAAFWSVGGFDPTLTMEQDWLLFVLLMRQYPRTAQVVPDHLVRYHLHDSNGSQDYRRAYAERTEVLSRLSRGADRETRAACRAGQRLNRRLRAAQAVDAGRAARREQDWRGVVLALSDAFRWDRRVVVHAIYQTL